MMTMTMTRNATKGLVVMGMAFAVASGSLACKEEGSLEKAGAAVDETIDDLTHPNEGPLEKAGRKVSESADDIAN